MTAQLAKQEATEWAIDYKPLSDDLTPQAYARYGYEQGFLAAVEKLSRVPPTPPLMTQDSRRGILQLLLPPLMTEDSRRGVLRLVLATLRVEAAAMSNTATLLESIPIAGLTGSLKEYYHELSERYLSYMAVIRKITEHLEEVDGTTPRESAKSQG